MCRLSWNLGVPTSRNPQGLSRPVMGLLYLYLFFFYFLTYQHCLCFFVHVFVCTLTYILHFLYHFNKTKQIFLSSYLRPYQLSCISTNLPYHRFTSLFYSLPSFLILYFFFHFVLSPFVWINFMSPFAPYLFLYFYLPFTNILKAVCLSKCRSIFSECGTGRQNALQTILALLGNAAALSAFRCLEYWNSSISHALIKVGTLYVTLLCLQFSNLKLSLIIT
jgi:hypothetical protein